MTSSAAAIRVGISPPGTLRIWSSVSFSPACFAKARVCSSRILSAVGLKFGWSQKMSFWSRAAKVLSGVKMLVVVANAAAPAPAFSRVRRVSFGDSIRVSSASGVQDRGGVSP